MEYHSLESVLSFCEEYGRQPTEEENDIIETPGWNEWDTGSYGSNLLDSLKSDIEAAKDKSEAESIIDKAEKSVEADINDIEKTINSYPESDE